MVITMTTQSVNMAIQPNLEYVKQCLHYPQNTGFIVREFRAKFADGSAAAFLAYFDGMSNQTLINRDILRALLHVGSDEPPGVTRRETVYQRIISLAPMTMVEELEKVIDQINFGACAIFIEGCDCAFVADVKGWNSRGVDAPVNEASLSGPQEAFVESIITNLALVRKILKDARLVAELNTVGKASKTPVSILYLDGITNPDIVDEVRRRITGIQVEYIFSSSDIEMLIEKNTFFPMTHTLKTERPDRVSAMLAEGKVVVMVQGSPFALVLPTTAGDLIEATEDNYVRVPEANMMRVIRLFGIALSLLLPGCFVAVMLYHHEMIPTDLLLAIEATRERVPFPLVFELILMEISFELIKEASVRVPSPIGSSLGIIGGLILGQAAVEANIVSPILIIVVAISGLGAFATPTVALSRSLSLLRFCYILFGAVGGFLGITCAVLINLALMASADTYSVPFLSPLTPKNHDTAAGAIFIKPIWKKERRPEALKTQDARRQPHISRKWNA